MRAPNIEQLNKASANKELQQAKDYYTNKNVEIDMLIKQVMAERGGPSAEEIAEEQIKMRTVLQQKPETIESLLKFLIYLVLHKEEVEVKKDEQG